MTESAPDSGNGPVAFRWDGERMTPAGPGALALARAYYESGEVYALYEFFDRDWNSHKHYFANLRDMWKNVPDARRDKLRARTPNSLRKFALVCTGWASRRDIDCESEAVAAAVAAAAEALNEYVVVKVKATSVVIWEPLSQSTQAMPGRGQFQQSKWDVLNWVADQLGIDPDDYHRRPD